MDVFVSIINTKILFKGTYTKYVGKDIMKIANIFKSVEYVDLTTIIVKRNNHASNKSINETSLTIYLIQIPKQKKQK